MKTRESLLTEEEKARNSHGPCLLYEYSPESSGVYPSSLPGAFPDIAVNHSRYNFKNVSLFSLDKFLYSHKTNILGVYWNQSVCLSVCPSVYTSVQHTSFCQSTGTLTDSSSSQCKKIE